MSEVQRLATVFLATQGALLMAFALVVLYHDIWTIVAYKVRRARQTREARMR